jgi:type I restriction enzyme, S subunit
MKTIKSLTEAELAAYPKLQTGWQWTRLGEIADNIQYGYTESSTKEPIGPKFLRITDIQNNEVIWKSVPYCKIDDAKKQNYMLKDGDLVFARTGATVGKSYLLKGDFPESIFASYLIRVRLLK